MTRRTQLLLVAICSANFLFALNADFAQSANPTEPDKVLGDYPSPSKMYEEIYSLATQYYQETEVFEYGRSVEGRALLALRIHCGDSKKRPEALISANIHGNEYIANRLAMAVAKRLLADAKTDGWINKLRESFDFWILPCINPDGYAKTWELGGNGKWAVMRKNANGVDLNRNFPRYGATWLPIAWAGSNNPKNHYYRGTGPYSEPETRAIRDFASSHRFFSAIDFHSWGGLIIPPKCPNHNCVIKYKRMANAYKAKQHYVKYKRLQFRLADQYTGEMEDMLYHEYGTLAVCIELSTSKHNRAYQKANPISFWQNNPRDIAFWVENDRDAALSAIEEAFRINGGNPIPPR